MIDLTLIRFDALGRTIFFQKETTMMQLARSLVLTLACAISVAMVSMDARAQSRADMEPVNDRPNPYRTVDDHFMMPISQMPRAGEAGRTWGSMPAMDVGIDGTSIWVTERCGANTCIGSDVAAVHQFDGSGRLVKSFGAGMFAWPHGIHVDQEGNVWVTDGRSATVEELDRFPDETNKGHTVYKFSPNGELLMTLGTPGIAGDPPNRLNEPCDVLIAPNGDILVAEGHDGQVENPGPNVVSRIPPVKRQSTDAKNVEEMWTRLDPEDHDPVGSPRGDSLLVRNWDRDRSTQFGLVRRGWWWRPRPRHPVG